MNYKQVFFIIFVVFIHGPGWLQAAAVESKEVLCEKKASALVREGKLEEGLVAINQCIAASPSRAKAHIILGYLLLEKGDGEQAKGAFEKALALSPRSSAAKTGKGVILSKSGELKAAESILQDALKLNPDPARTYYELGFIYEQLGDLEKALTHYKLGIKSHEQNNR